MTRLAGKLSSMDTPVIGVPVEFCSVIVTVAGLPAVIVLGEIVFVAVNSPVTVRLALTVVGLEINWSSVKLPAGIVFTRTAEPAVTGVVTVNL